MVERSAVNRVVAGSSPARGGRKHLMKMSLKKIVTVMWQFFLGK